MENFVFPKKWKIKITENNHKMISDYFLVVSSCYKSETCVGDIINSHNSTGEPVKKGSNESFLGNRPDVVLITDEQFLKFVVNKDKTPTFNSNYPIF